MKCRFFFVVGFLCFATFSTPKVLCAEIQSGSQAPAFTLNDIYGNPRSLDDFSGKTIVLEWTNYDCPFVKKHYNSGNMQATQQDAVKEGVVWISINSSAPGKQGNYSAAEWQSMVRDRQSAASHILLDPSGEVGRLYSAKTTPHIFIITPSGNLVYQGAIDSIASADPVDIKKATNYVDKTLNELEKGQDISNPVTKSYGCSVKY